MKYLDVNSDNEKFRYRCFSTLVKFFNTGVPVFSSTTLRDRGAICRDFCKFCRFSEKKN